MKTFKVICSLKRPHLVDLGARYTIEAHTGGDAILSAQNRFAKEFGLSRAEAALVRVEFEL